VGLMSFLVGCVEGLNVSLVHMKYFDNFCFIF
jgi:hypothetical protein